MKKNYLPSEKHLLNIKSIRESYGIIYKCLNSLDFVSELLSIKEKNPKNEKLRSMLVFFGASYLREYLKRESVLEDQKTISPSISVLFDILGADHIDRIFWVIYSKKDFLEIKKEFLKIDFKGKKIIKSYF